MTRRADAQALDRDDPLASRRSLFALPAGTIYLDGNSLGPLTHAARRRVARVVEDEWGEDLIRSWTAHGWIDLPATVGAKIARLLGAHADEPAEVVVADSTSVNLFKVVAGALELRPGRRLIVSEEGNFPTDLYMLQGLAGLLGGSHELVLAPSPDRPRGLDDPDAPVLEILAARGDEVAAVVLTQVDYRTGALHDMERVTRAAHAAGALAVWDLAHSAGALPVDLEAAGADLAVGCGYKYLNGGPGAPAFLYVARRHQEAITSPLTGWLGHAEPFAFTGEYRPAPGVDRFRCGTPPILSLAALDAALDAFDGVDLGEIRKKSMALGELFLERVAATCAGTGGIHLEPACPADPAARGSQVSLAVDDGATGYAIVQALIERGVVGDFRAPNILRFGFAPLYLRYVDVWDAVDRLARVLETREWDRPELKRRAAVT